MNTAKMLATHDDLAPEEALHDLIALERIRARTNLLETCVWCGKPANNKRYPEPSGEITSAINIEASYRACSRSHAVAFAARWIRRYNDTLRPWHAIEGAHARGETHVSINHWPFTVGTNQRSV